MKTTKQLYDAMLTEPAKPSLGHTSKKMDVADKLFAGPGDEKKSKKMAAGGFVRSADGCVQRGKTRGRFV